MFQNFLRCEKQEGVWSGATFMEAFFFPELMVRLFYVLVIHGLATQKKKNPFLSLTGLAEIWRREVLFFFPDLCRNISHKSNKDETAYGWSNTTLADMEDGLLLFCC